MTTSKPADRCRVAVLRGFDSGDNQVFTLTVSFREYYDGRLEVIDNKQFRQANGIVRLVGILFDDRGEKAEEFENRYGSDGAYRGGRVRFADGTVQED